MPKRTNEFQQLIRKVYDCMKVIEGGKVTESAIIIDRDGNSREIDVLIEIDSFGHSIKIAVECRDRSRQDDIQWIDALIGKYNNTNIDKIIAVSSSGFTVSASKKALSNGIEPMTLNEFEETNWPDKIEKIKVGIISLTFNLIYVTLTVLPATGDKVKKEWIVCNDGGESIGTVEDLIKYLLTSKIYGMAKEYFDKEYMPNVKSIAYLKHRIDISVSVEINNLFIDDLCGCKYKIKHLYYIVGGVPVIEETKIKRYMYGSKA